MTLYVKISDASYVNMDAVVKISIHGKGKNFELVAMLPDGEGNFYETLAQSDSESTMQGMANQLFDHMKKAAGTIRIIYNAGTEFVPMF